MPIKLISSGGGEFTVQPAASATNRTVTLPDASTTLVGTDATQTLSNKSIVGVTDGSSAATGQVGEHVISQVLVGGAISLSNVTQANITSITLTAGDWDVSGLVRFAPNTTTSVTFLACSVSTSSANLQSDFAGTYRCAATVFGTNYINVIAPVQRISITSTTTVYLVAYQEFTVSTMTGYGHIRARRVR